MALHSTLTQVDGIHTVVSFVYADATERLAATGLVDQDFGKVAYQEDDGTMWLLVSLDPVTWTAFGGAPPPHAASHAAGGSDAIQPATPTQSGLMSAAQAAQLAISATFSNVDYAFAATVNIAMQTGTLTAVRSVTLPLASSFAAGVPIYVADFSGSVTPTNYLNIQRAGSDTIGGQTSVRMTLPGDVLEFKTDGASEWSCRVLRTDMLFSAGMVSACELPILAVHQIETSTAGTALSTDVSTAVADVILARMPASMTAGLCLLSFRACVSSDANRVNCGFVDCVALASITTDVDGVATCVIASDNVFPDGSKTKTAINATTGTINAITGGFRAFITRHPSTAMTVTWVKAYVRDVASLP